MLAPVISVELDGDCDCFRLMATSHGTCEPCGPRLFRGGELPAIDFIHIDEMDALRDAEMLQRYCDLAWSGKAPKGKGRKEKEEIKLTPLDFRNAVWNC